MEDNKIMGKLEARIDKWLEEFEEKPFSMGVKVIFVVIIIRWVWRSFK